MGGFATACHSLRISVSDSAREKVAKLFAEQQDYSSECALARGRPAPEQNVPHNFTNNNAHYCMGSAVVFARAGSGRTIEVSDAAWAEAHQLLESKPSDQDTVYAQSRRLTPQPRHTCGNDQFLGHEVDLTRSVDPHSTINKNKNTNNTRISAKNF